MDTSNDEWAENEVRAAVRDYFTTLRAELRGRSAGTTGRWHPRLGRADDPDPAALERKYGQIGAVLMDHGLPYCVGRAPVHDYRPSLVMAVREYLRNHPHLLELMEGAVFRPVRTLPALDALEPRRVLSQPPAGTVAAGVRGATELIAGVDFLEKEQRNRSLAMAGQQFVLAFERRRLQAQGLHKYAGAIEHVSAEHGDGAGFDVLSYGVDGSERYIGVKTTRFRRETPLYLSAHEVAMSETWGGRYWIYRVHNFRDGPRLYMVNGPLAGHFDLEPTQYRARF